MASSAIVQCSCGRNYNSLVLAACPACRPDVNQVPEKSLSSSSSSNSAQGSMPRRESQGATAATREVTRDAESQASSLLVVASVVSVIGIIGGVITCLGALFLLGDETSRPIGILLLASGVAAILIWVFIGTFAQTVAAGVKVLVVIARSQEHSN
jgi:predicted anti-sigma-YlaC factor YlaD